MLSFVGVPDHDPDFACFTAIESETDALPVGAERRHWAEEALARKAVEIERAEKWALEYGGREAFESIVRRFGPPARPDS